MGHPFLAFTAPLVHPSICVIDDAATAGISTLRGPRNTTAARTASKHGSMAALHTAVCATQDGRMAVTRTTGGAGNDEDAGNGDVCVYAYVRVCLCVCVHVYLCARHTCCAVGPPPQFLASPGRVPPPHGHTAHGCA